MNLNELLKKTERTAKTIFDIDVPLRINEENLPAEPHSESMGDYDFYKDEITIYINKIQQTANRYDLDLEKIITYVMCHEHGHTKQARISEANRLFPPYIIMNKRCAMSIDGTKIPVEYKDVSPVINWLQDFCIDKELHKHDISNVWVKFRMEDLKLNPVGSKVVLKYVRMKYLPLDMEFYEFGELSNSERKEYEETIKDSVGEKWDSVHDIMKLLHFTNIDAYKNVFGTIIETIFKQSVEFWLQSTEEIFKGKSRPSFWKEIRYLVSVITPKINTCVID